MTKYTCSIQFFLILVGILLQSIAVLIQIILLRSRKEEWNAILKYQGQDIDKKIKENQLFKIIPIIIVSIAISIQAYGIWLNQFDNLEQLEPIWKEIEQIKIKLNS